jgi:hypothetical protein
VDEMSASQDQAPGAANPERLLHAEVASLRDDLRRLREAAQALDKKIGILLAQEPATTSHEKEDGR